MAAAQVAIAAVQFEGSNLVGTRQAVAQAAAHKNVNVIESAADRAGTAGKTAYRAQP